MSFLGRLFGGARAPREEHAPEGDPVRVAEVEAVLLELAPAIAMDGGRVELRAVGEDGVVHLALRGACERCYASPTTIEGLVEPRLRERCAWLASVRADA